MKKLFNMVGAMCFVLMFAWLTAAGIANCRGNIWDFYGFRLNSGTVIEGGLYTLMGGAGVIIVPLYVLHDFGLIGNKLGSKEKSVVVIRFTRKLLILGLYCTYLAIMVTWIFNMSNQVTPQGAILYIPIALAAIFIVVVYILGPDRLPKAN